MELSDYRDNIKLQLFGGLLNQEISDDVIDKIILLSLTELNRYYSLTSLKQVKAEDVIDLTSMPEISTVINVYRSEAIGSLTGTSAKADPTFMSQLQMYNMGSTYYSNDWIYNYSNFSQLQRISNTVSTDLDYIEDKPGNKLYINYSQGRPSNITIEYVPRLMDPSEVIGEYWQDILQRLSLAHTKITLGRIRTRFKQSGAVWEGDGDTILQEGNTELKELQDRLRDHSDLGLPLD